MNAIRSLAIGAAALLSVTAAHAQTHTMKISSPTVNDLSQEWAKEFKAGVEARSGGKIKVEFYPANQLGQIPATVEGIAMGTIEGGRARPAAFSSVSSRASRSSTRPACSRTWRMPSASSPIRRCASSFRRSAAARASSRWRSWRMAR